MSSRRIVHRPAPTPPLDPHTFVQRLPAVLGTDRGKELVERAFAIVDATGKPNAWIFEVRRARENGSISPAVARFLIFKFTESAITALMDTHPQLSRITARIVRIEQEHGLGEGEFWHVHEGPLEWQALNREWDALADRIMIETWLRNGEHELAAGYPLDDDPLFEEGRMLLFGPREQT